MLRDNPKAPLILLVEDDDNHSEMMKASLHDAPEEYRLQIADTLKDACTAIKLQAPDLVLADYRLPDGDGSELVAAVKGLCPVVLLTSQGNIQVAVDAMKIGLQDYVVKSPEVFCGIPRIAQRCLREWSLIQERKQAEESLRTYQIELESMVSERTLELAMANLELKNEIEEHKRADESLLGAFAEIRRLKERLRAENIYLRQEIAQQFNFGKIIGQSNAIRHILTLVEQVAPMDATVLLLGETGTGKGVIARAIHSHSVRKERPMITVNCMSLPANLIESELFGREKGAFTGAHARQIGRFELADGGTIFLDEIGEMPLELQSKLLRVIQEGEFERLGSPHTIKTDVRIIAASNRNLDEEIRNGRFREDLFYRLNVFPITIPPLRQRVEDIPLLVNYFVAKFNKKIGKKIDTVSNDILDTLQKYNWPGNVRELESVIERAVIICQGNSLQISDRFDAFHKAEGPAERNVKALALLEQEHILQVLQKTGWRIDGVKGAALLLGLNASTLRSRMRKYGIHRT